MFEFTRCGKVLLVSRDYDGAEMIQMLTCEELAAFEKSLDSRSSGSSRQLLHQCCFELFAATWAMTANQNIARLHGMYASMCVWGGGGGGRMPALFERSSVTVGDK